MKFSWFCRGDIDGFFGLFVDNLLQLMLIKVLCQSFAGLPPELVDGRILPGAALSILAGNFFYAWQAKRLAERESKPETTALPYGINTVSLFAHIFLVMAPVYQNSHDPNLAWEAGLFACLGSALIELMGAFVGDWLRRHTPRAALLSALAGIALSFIAMGFVFEIFAKPALAFVPAMLILFAYASQQKLPFGVPAGLLALLLGTAVAWTAKAFGLELFTPSHDPIQLGMHWPQANFLELWNFIFREEGWKYLSVIFPMGLFNVIGSLQNLESAEAAGDKYETRSSLLANGLGGLLAALLGSPFPTTIYIGHPGWKAMGARWGYSILNGTLIALICLCGALTAILHVVPIEAAIGILLWIGLVITAQAFGEVPRKHYIAVAIGFIPTLAAWLLLEIQGTLAVAGSSLSATLPKFGDTIYIEGVLALNQGFILTSMILASVFVWVAELRFSKAALWCLAAALLSFFGIIHAYEIGPLGLESHFGFNVAPSFSIAYLASSLLLLAMQALGLKPERDTAMAHALLSGERRDKARSGSQKRSKRKAPQR